MSTTQPTLIDAALDCLRGTVPAGSSLILFGSHGRNEAREDSDIDLLVIEPDVADRMAEMVRLSDLLGRRLIPADVVVLSRDAFDQQSTVPNTLAYRAAREGKVYDIPA